MTCPRLKKDCVNLGVGRECLALTDTHFGQSSCPFYKPAKTNYKTKYVFEGRAGVWCAVRGYEGRYYVSDEGKVYNYRNREVNISYHKGRPFVKLEDKYGFVTRYYVARLVADAFIAGEGMIKHKDDDLLNCKAENLYREVDNGNKEN